MRTIQGATIEHWMDKRIREHKSINDPTNLIRISASDIIKLIDYKNSLLGTTKSILEESKDYEEREKVAELWQVPSEILS